MRRGPSSSLLLVFPAILSACGGSDSDGNLPVAGDLAPPAARSVVGTIDAGPVAEGVAREPMFVTLDGRVDRGGVDRHGRFHLGQVPDGDHTVFVHIPGSQPVGLPCRMLTGRGMNLGTVTIRDGRVTGRTGFDGYRAGYVDDDGDGANDLCTDSNGDGICDPGGLYAGCPYVTDCGFADADGDGINDRFVDADGDGRNDLTGRPYGHGFGWVDDDGDGTNDIFRDADGDGICDVNGMPFRHPFGYTDEDRDGRNDGFRDGDGDVVNDVTGEGYVAMPGWRDANDDDKNDRFRDANGDGIMDPNGLPMPYAHGMGWVDEDGDGKNDLFRDSDGDGINDLSVGPYAGMPTGYGYVPPHTDSNGDGVDDRTGVPYPCGFGWVDANRDGVNDNFRDANGDGTDDRSGIYYARGYMMGDRGAHWDGDRWAGGPWGDDGHMDGEDHGGMGGPMR